MTLECGQEGEMFNYFKKRAEAKRSREAATKAGYEAGTAISQAVEDYLNRRLPEVSNKLLAVLRERFNTIYDEPQVSPKVAAQIEYDIFVKNTDEYPTRIKEEMQLPLHEWMELASQAGIRELLDQYVSKLISDAHALLRLEAALMLTEVVKVSETKESRPTPA
jgi:hypothetical protein